MNSTSVAGQSQPSLSRSQAHSTLVSPFSNRASTSRRSLALLSPDTASAATPSIMEPTSDLLSVLDRGAEDDCPLVLHILEPSVYNELVSLRYIDFALQIPNVVLDAVEPNL